MYTFFSYITSHILLFTLTPPGTTIPSAKIAILVGMSPSLEEKAVPTATVYAGWLPPEVNEISRVMPVKTDNRW